MIIASATGIRNRRIMPRQKYFFCKTMPEYQESEKDRFSLGRSGLDDRMAQRHRLY